MSRLHTVDLTALAYGGEAVGRLKDGRVVFVPYAIPGETVRARLVEEKSRFARADLVEVLNPAAQRISPRCAHFGVCGGCHYQYLPYEAQLTAKTTILREQLERIGGVVDPPVVSVVPSPDPYSYRNTVQFHLTSQGKLGFHKARSREVLAIQECHLPEAPLGEVWSKLDFEAATDLERIGLRLGGQGEIQLILESGSTIPPALAVEELPISVIHCSPAGSLVLAGSQAVAFEVLGRPFQVSAGSFFQVNTKMAGLMVEHLITAVPRYHPLTPATVLIEAYCGVGLFSAFLAGKVGNLIGVEASPSAVEDFCANLDQFDNVAIYEATVEEILPELALTPDIILIDPPREGISRKALEGLLQLEASLLAYVSCDPTTLARDARRLTAGGYHLSQITLFDLFPQTYHLETISLWVR